MSADNQILLTGASGFVATHVLASLLAAGYNVRATVRSNAKARSVISVFSKHSSQLSFSIVPDIIAPGAFDEAVKGVVGVIHTASPYFVSNVTDNKSQLLDPAVKGTLNVLQAVKQHAPQVKRVVITSSFAAVVDLSKGARPGYTYTEKDWNPATFEEALTSSNGAFTYCASKKLAEKAAYDFVENEKPNFTIATVCPPMVYGPAVQHIESLKALNTSTADIYRFMNGSTETVPDNGTWAFVDVRDLAEAHVKSYEHATGGRFLVTAGTFTYGQVVDAILKVPGVDSSKVSQNPERVWPEHYELDNSKAKTELGINFIGIEQCIKDTAAQLVALEKRLKH